MAAAQEPTPAVQLPLGLSLDEGATLTNWVAGPNAAVLAALGSCLESREPAAVYVWGPGGRGKTHLLQAAARGAAHQGQRVAYVPLSQAEQWSVDMLEDLDQMQLVCLDDVHRVAGNVSWETALFAVVNGIRDRGGCLLASGEVAPAQLGMALPDLSSRLAWGLVFHLERLSDQDRAQALRLRARARGLDAPDEVVNYLLRHHTRDLPSLLELLDGLDRASLAEQRRLTLPFVRQFLQQREGP